MDLERQYSPASIMGVRTVKDFLDSIWSLSQFLFCELDFDTGIEDPLFPIFPKKIYS